MEIPAVNNSAGAVQVARGARVEPPAPPEEGNNPNPGQATAANDQNNQIAIETNNNDTVVIRRLTPVDVVERQNAPDIEAIPQQVNVPDPFDNIGGGAPEAKPPLPAPPEALPATPPPEAPENTSPQGANNEDQLGTQVEAPATPPTPTPAEPPTAAPATTATTIAATPATQTEPNQTARGVQQDEANGQANNNPIAEQEIGGTVNIAI